MHVIVVLTCALLFSKSFTQLFVRRAFPDNSAFFDVINRGFAIVGPVLISFGGMTVDQSVVVPPKVVRTFAPLIGCITIATGSSSDSEPSLLPSASTPPQLPNLTVTAERTSSSPIF